MKPKIHGWKPSKYQPDPAHVRMVVDVHIRDMCTTEDIVWVAGNSYILAEVPEKSISDRTDAELDRWFWKIDGKWVELVSVNGAGEIRWDLPKDRIQYRADDQVVANHFHLDYPRKP